MAGKYWWEEDDKQSNKQTTTQSNTQTEKKYWWETDAQQSKPEGYWWDDGNIANAVGNNITSQVNNWLQNHNSYITDYQKRYEGRKGTYEDAYVSDSADWLNTVTQRKSTYDAEADAIIAYITQNKDYLDKGWVNRISDTIANARKQQGSILESVTKDNEWWNKFAPNEEQAAAGYTSEKLYNEWQSGQKQYADDLSFDVEAGTLELEELKKERDAYLADQEEKRKQAQEDESFWESLGRWLGNTPDTTIPLAGANEPISSNGYTNEYDKRIAELEERIERSKYVQGYEGYMGNMGADDYAANSQYVSTRTDVAKEDALWGLYKNQYDESQLFGDFLYDYINRNEDALSVAMVNDTASDAYLMGFDKGFLQTMKDEEIGVYNYLYKTQGQESANAFLSYIQSDLEGRRRIQEQEQWAAYAKESPVGSSVFSTLISPLKGMSYLGQAADMLDDGKMNENAGYNRFSYIPSTIRSTVSNTIENSGKWGKVGSFAYNTGMSMADFLFTTAVSGGNQGLSLAIMGTGAAADATLAAKDRGLEDGEAFALGTIAGLAEVAMEKISLGAWLEGDMTEGALRYVLKNALSEGGEEAGTSMINLLADVMIAGDKSEWNMAMQAYIDQGKSPQEAFGLVAAEQAAQIGLDALGGILSGGVIGGGTYAGTSIAAGFQYGNIAKNKESAQKLVAEGLELNPDSQYVQKAQSKLDKGKNLTGMQVRNILAANQEQITANDMQKIQQAAEKRLADLGQTKDVSKVAELATKYATGSELTRAEKSFLAKSEYGSRVANELTPTNIASENFSTEWAEEIGTKKVNAAAYNKKGIEMVQSIIEQMKNMDDPNAYKSLESRMEADEPVQVSDTGKAVIRATGEEVDLTSPTFKQITEDGVVLDANGKTVRSNEIDYDTGDQGIAINGISKIEHITPAAATALYAKLDMTKSVMKQLNGMDEAFTYGFYNYPEADLEAGNFAGNLTQNQKTDAYKLGQYVRGKSDVDNDVPIVKMRTTADAKLTAEQKTAQQKARIESKDVEVYFEDGKTITRFDEHTGKYDKKRMAAVNTAKFLSKLGIGGKYYFFESYENADGVRVYKDANGNEVEAPNGMYKDADGSIHIDLNAGDRGQGTALFTMGHELTHFIKAQSKRQFKVLGDLVKEAFDKTDMSMHERVLAKQKFLEDKRGKKVSYDEAYEEVVADAMSTMLTDGSFYDKLMEIKVKDKDLFNTIKRFFQKMIAKFKKVYEELTPDQKDAQDIRAMKDMFDKIQTAFVEGLVEASENFHASEQVLAESGIAVNSKTESGSLLSVRDVLNDKDRKKVAKALADRFNVTEKEAMDWLKAETSLASIILNPKYSAFLDYEADPNEVAIKQNSDYPQGTVDFSNICKKRREFTQVMNRILRNFPNHVFAATDLAKIRTIMGEEGMTLPCGICYVEDRRQLDSIVAQDFIDGLKLYREGSKTRPDGKPFNANQLKGLQLTDGDTYVPSIYELVTLEGRNSLKEKNPNMEAAWVKYNNARGMQAVRLLTNEAEYKRQILKYTPKTVQTKNDYGGLRIYSFSDAEMFHLIDIIQVLTDCAAVGLKVQGYTKVNEYAKAVKDTGEKLNRSLIPLGDLGYHMENGKVVLDYDPVEGIDIYSEDFFDSKDNPDVGNIVIGINPTQIRAAMVSDFVDYIIPFHTGQSAEVLGEKGIAAWVNYKDSQSEIDLATGKKSAHQINIYTEVFQAAENEGKPIRNKRDFVDKFLAVCKENGLKPRFAEFLNTDANGDYVYTEGYHKFLVDFKTFAQTEVGEYLPQMPVKPIFDNGYITDLLETYVKEQQVKDAEVAKQMPKVIERITNEIVKPSSAMGTLYSDRSVTSWDIAWDSNNFSSLKEQMIAHQDEINAMATVTDVIFDKSKGKSYAVILNDILRTRFGYSIERQDGAKFLFDETAIGTMRHYVNSDEEAAAVIAAPYVLKRGKAISGHKNHKGNGYPSVTYAAPVTINGDRVNVGVAVLFTDKDRPHSLRVLMPSGKEYVMQKIKTDPGMEEASPKGGVPSPTGSVSNDKVSQPESKVKKNSDRNSERNANRDAEYLDAVKRGDTETAQRMVDEAAKKAGYNTTGYHGTHTYGFTVVDGSLWLARDKKVAKTFAPATGVKEWKETSPYDKDGVYPFYYRLGNNLRIDAEGASWGALPVTEEEYPGVYVIDEGDYQEITTNAMAEWAYGNGYDSITFANVDDGGFTTVDVVFNPNRDAKSANPVTYDDKGNVIPLSERFNSKNTDIRHSERGEGTSNRDLLANAFEGITQNSIEYKMIQEYKGRIKLLNEYEDKLANLNAEIRKLTFGTEGVRDTKKLKELQEEAKKTAENINRNDKKLLSLEASEPLRKVIERERKKEAQKTKEHVKEIQQNKKTRAEQAEYRHKIRKTIRELDKILKRGNKQRNVKEDMKGFVSKALELADYLFTDHVSNDDLIRNGITVRMTPKEAALVNETEDILSKLYDHADSLTDEEFTRLDTKRKANEDKLRDLLTAQRNERLNTPVYKLFNDLVTEYASLQNSNQDAVRAAYNSEVERLLRSFAGDEDGKADTDRKKTLENMRVADMTTEELWKLYNAYTMVLTTVRDANKLHVKGKLESIDTVVADITRDFSKRKIPDKKVAIIARNIANKLGWDYEKLYYALDRIGSEAFTELVMNIANSENIVMQDIMEAAAFRDEIVKKYGFNNWDVNKEIDREFLDTTGKKFKLTLGELMSLYAYSRREGAWDHIEYGGFVFGEAALTNPRPADSYKLTKEQCEAITNTLTKEQKGYVEDMQKFLSETMGEKGNEVSMLLYGIKMFGEKNYFPIHIAGQFKAQANESQAKAAAGFSSMSNAGFTHAQNPKAKAPFVLEGFNDIWADHVNEMSRYHGTVPALEDMRRVMNRSSYSESTAESMAIKQLMENSFGKEAVDYFDNLYREANSGAITDKLQKDSKWLLSKFRKNSVAYSLSVLVQQPASLVRAYALIDKKYFGFNGFGTITSGVAKAVSNKWTKAHTNAYNEMLKYAPGVTMAKEIGGFDTATGGSIRSYLLDTNKSIKQKWQTENAVGKGKAVMDLVDNNAIANLPNVADKIAWIEIWNACKRETVAKHKDLATNSEEFMQAVGERFTEVIRATQVYDSIFAKSPMLKSKNLAVQYLVSFMNEPNVIANMAESAVRDATRGNWKSGVRTAAVLIHSVIFTNLLKSIVYAMRDDDEDETYIEKYLEAVTGNMMDDFIALNYIPLARDVWSLAQGYDVERADMAIVADAIDALNRVIKNGFTETEGMTEDELIEFDKKCTEANWKLVESLASFFGIPVKNIRREIEGVLDHAKIASANAGQTTAQSAWDKVYDAVIESIPFIQTKRDKQDKLYDAIISGDLEYLSRLKSTYKDEDAYQNAVRKALRESDSRIHDAAQAKYEGRTEDYKRIFREIQKEGKFSFDDIMSAVNSEESAIRNGLEPDKVTSSYTASDFVESIVLGDPKSAEAMKEDIISSKVANGKTQADAEKEFISSVATGIRDAYSSGLLDEARAEEMLVEYAGKDEEEAASKVNYWAFCEAHPQYELTESNVTDYQEFAEPAEIPLDAFVQYVNGTKGLASKYDEWGDVEVTKREQVLEVIDSLPLTWQQKDALYLAAGYSEDKIWDVPW